MTDEPTYADPLRPTPKERWDWEAWRDAQDRALQAANDAERAARAAEYAAVQADAGAARAEWEAEQDALAAQRRVDNPGDPLVPATGSTEEERAAYEAYRDQVEDARRAYFRAAEAAQGFPQPDGGAVAQAARAANPDSPGASRGNEVDALLGFDGATNVPTEPPAVNADGAPVAVAPEVVVPDPSVEVAPTEPVVEEAPVVAPPAE